MSQPATITYHIGESAHTLVFKRGPVDFRCWQKTRLHDNVATSGIRERVVEGTDLFISFTMPAIMVGDDLAGWTAFMAYAVPGNIFELNPDSASTTDWLRCTCENDAFELQRVGPGRYSASLLFRAVRDEKLPSTTRAVYDWFYGVHA